MQRTSGVHPLMRDDKTLQQCVKKLEDDTKLCVRLLDVPETVTKDDVVVVVRLWRPMTEGTLSISSPSGYHQHGVSISFAGNFKAQSSLRL